MADDVTLVEFARTIRRQWKAVVLLAAGVLVGATIYAETLPDEYEGRVVVAFSPRPEANVDGNTIRVVMPKYVAYATARATANRVARVVDERPGDVHSAIDASVAPESGNLTLTANLGSSRRAARLANALAADVVRFAAEDELLRPVIVAPALPPSSPAGPPRRLIEAAALVVGVVLGVAVALLLERGRPRVRTAREIALVSGFPVVGRIPSSRALRGPLVDALNDPEVGSAVRTLRTNLERASRDRPVQTVVVTSGIPGEGKTSVATMLALSLARLDARVLLVDADLRRPSVAEVFGIHTGDGPLFSELLRGKAMLEACLRRGPVGHLELLPARVDPEAGDLLARRGGEVLTDLRRDFDVVVLDTTPLLGADDARTLSAFSDGVLLVVRTDTLASALSDSIQALEAVRAPVVGVVANRVSASERLGSYVGYGAYEQAVSELRG